MDQRVEVVEVDLAERAVQLHVLLDLQHAGGRPIEQSALGLHDEQMSLLQYPRRQRDLRGSRERRQRSWPFHGGRWLGRRQRRRRGLHHREQDEGSAPRHARLQYFLGSHRRHGLDCDVPLSGVFHIASRGDLHLPGERTHGLRRRRGALDVGRRGAPHAGRLRQGCWNGAIRPGLVWPVRARPPHGGGARPRGTCGREKG
mmetsp:Transcript_108571/g.312782  ORF Transcript_108571/g.312782 Transcript_108571/m.312782 type:complete len:201 (+) Transcript_108571:2586-3188(+)